MEIFPDFSSKIKKTSTANGKNSRSFILAPLNKDTVSFSASRQYSSLTYQDSELYEIPNDKEFKDLKKELKSSLEKEEIKTLENSFFTITAADIMGYITKENVKLALKFFSDSSITDNLGNLRHAIKVLSNINTPEKLKITQEIFSDERLYLNEEIKCELPNIIYGTNQENIEAKSNLVSKISNVLSNGNSNNKNFSAAAASMLKIPASDALQTADRILSDEKYFNNPYVLEFAKDNLSERKTSEQLEFINLILDNDRLCNNEEFLDDAYFIISNIDNNEIKESKKYLLNKVLSDERFIDNPDAVNYLKSALETVKTVEDADIKFYLIERVLTDDNLKNNNAKKTAEIVIGNSRKEIDIQLAERILSNECLYNNLNFVQSVYDIDMHISNNGAAEKTIEMIDKILSKEELYNNKNFMAFAGKIIDSCDDIAIDGATEKYDVKSKLLDKLLTDWDDSGFINHAGFIISKIDNYSDYQELSDCIDEIINDKVMSKNPDIKEYAGFLFDMAGMDFNEAKIRIDVLKEILYDKNSNLTKRQILNCLVSPDEYNYKNLQMLNEIMGAETVSSLPFEDMKTASQFYALCSCKNINEIPLSQKKYILQQLVASNSDLFEISDVIKEKFPLIPKNQEEYCTVLPALVRSLGIETNTLSDEQIDDFNTALNNLGETLSEISDDEFNNLEIKQEYSKDDFIADILEKTSGLNRIERQKVYDYYGFELSPNNRTKSGFSISGYPVNLNSGKELAVIDNPNTKKVVETLRENVIHFSENNPITCNDETIEKNLNEIVKELPEIRTMIGKKQSPAHYYDVMTHSLKVMKKITETQEYNSLNESDKKIILLAALFHDITKREGYVDKTHEKESSFDSFFITNKFKLTQEEEIKLHTLIKYHEWLGRVNTSSSDEELIKNIRSSAYDLRHDNIFDMSLMFTRADLKAVKKDDSFYNTHCKAAENYGKKIQGYILELKKSQPVLPVTQIPSAGKIKEKITKVNQDGSTDIKGVYQDKDGLIIIKYNEVEDWQAAGFGKDCISHGIKTKSRDNEETDTGNIKFIAHGLVSPAQLARFDAFSLIDSDALLSVSYMERPESKFRLFRPQGVLLDVDTKYIHGGGETDSGSGRKKSIQTFKDCYLPDSTGEKDRFFVSDMIKSETGMNDNEYIDFVKNNSNKSFDEIYPVELREKLIKGFASMNYRMRQGERQYNEMFISNPKKIMGVYAYNTILSEKIGNPVDFLNSEYNYVSDRVDFLRQYALENDVPFIVFGD